MTGHVVEKIFVSEKNIGYCRACYACRNSHQCIINDDMAQILDKMIYDDVLVLASPVYFFAPLNVFAALLIASKVASNAALSTGTGCTKKTDARNSKFATDAYELGKDV